MVGLGNGLSTNDTIVVDVTILLEHTDTPLSSFSGVAAQTVDALVGRIADAGNVEKVLMLKLSVKLFS
jgi:hypothetical protein